MNNLKLYVWEGVYTDWTDGIAFTLAENSEQARKILKAEHKEEFGGDTDEFDNEPLEVTEPKAFLLLGGA